jgi:hypothetical protein
VLQWIITGVVWRVALVASVSAGYLASKQAEGKAAREALRCLKRHLARHVWRILQPSHRSARVTAAILDGNQWFCSKHLVEI